MTLLQRLKSPGPKRMLALDGGGIRGALTAGYLVEMEKLLRQRHGNPQLVQTLERMGQPLYRFEAPTGFPDRASFWMNNGAVVERINFGIALTANRIPGTRVDLKGFKDPESAALVLGSPEFQKK